MNDGDFALAKRIYDERLSPAPRRSHMDTVPLKTFFSLQPEKLSQPHGRHRFAPGAEWGWHPRMSGRLGLCRLVHARLALKIVEAGRD